MKQLSAHKRGYTARWAKYSQRYRANNPWCVDCLKRGLHTPSQCVDHIQAVIGGDDPLFWEPTNHQALCHPCHQLKTVAEDGAGHGQSHPTWLPKPACEVIIVCGPPGSGKTTYAKEHARKWDTIIDLDDCFERVCGVHGHEADRGYLPQALRLRNKMIAQLEHKTDGRAYLIVGAPTKAERQWWASQLNGAAILMDTDEATCLSRIDGPRAQERREAVRKWFRDARANAWTPPKPRQTIGLDGWPVD